jgi:hypothetical protein
MQGGALGDALCKPGQACAGPDPDRIAEGNAYLDAEFPLLTRVKQATFVAHDKITIGASPPALVTDANPPSASSSPGAAAPAEPSAQASAPQQPLPTVDTTDADHEGEGDGGMSAGAMAGIVLGVYRGMSGVLSTRMARVGLEMIRNGPCCATGLGAGIAVGALVAMRMRRRAAARRGSGRTASDTVMMSDKSADDYAYSTSNL